MLHWQCLLQQHTVAEILFTDSGPNCSKSSLFRYFPFYQIFFKIALKDMVHLANAVVRSKTISPLGWLTFCFFKFWHCLWFYLFVAFPFPWVFLVVILTCPWCLCVINVLGFWLLKLFAREDTYLLQWRQMCCYLDFSCCFGNKAWDFYFIFGYLIISVHHYFHRQHFQHHWHFIKAVESGKLASLPVLKSIRVCKESGDVFVTMGSIGNISTATGMNIAAWMH